MAFAVAPNGGSIPLAALADSADPVTLRIELGGLLPDLAGLGLRNRDTSRRLEIISAKVFDPKEAGGFKPRKPISTAGDALVSVDGVEASRDSNEIKDMIPGVTLQLKDTTDKPVKLTVEPDRKAAKDAIIAMVGNYNKLIDWVNLLTRNDPTLMPTYFTDAEKKTANERLGIYQGDSTLSVLRNSLQRVMQEPYATRLGGDLSLLAQIGISSDSRKPGTGQGLDASKLKGDLEIDEDTLDKALASNIGAVRDIFGSDTNGDLIIDSGVAVSLDNIAKPYVETGGIIAIKGQTLKTQIDSETRTIATLDQSLAAKQDELKRKYGIMEGALNNMQGTSNSINQFSTNGGG
jgi:flagellar hook-associated protein 2